MKKDIYTYELPYTNTKIGVYYIYKNGIYFTSLATNKHEEAEEFAKIIVASLNNRQYKITFAMYVVALFSIIGAVSTLYYFFEVLLPTLV